MSPFLLSRISYDIEQHPQTREEKAHRTITQLQLETRRQNLTCSFQFCWTNFNPDSRLWTKQSLHYWQLPEPGILAVCLFSARPLLAHGQHYRPADLRQQGWGCGNANGSHGATCGFLGKLNFPHLEKVIQTPGSYL